MIIKKHQLFLLEEICTLAYKMTGLENSTKEESMIFAKYVHKKMSREQLESILLTPSLSKSIPKPKLRPKKICL